MKKLNLYVFISALITLLCFNSCGDASKNATVFIPISVEYPETKMEDVIDNYHGTEVNDPFRWLEMDTSTEVRNWIKEQNEVTFGYLNQLPYRNQISERLTELFNYPRYTAPRKIGDYYLYRKNDGLQNQSVIYLKEGLDGESSVFIDPNELDPDGLISINLLGNSPCKQYVAYGKQKAGSDWVTIGVYEVATAKKTGG
jgi:prolyl oligopeptidase